ncbi:MAG: hypothetical protein KQI35_07785 [Bacteroidetes bacterium]|nr:hypothetical protein [Bacteroidota bacterium]
MNIDYIAPFSNAWNRMKKALFQPFDLGKWFVVGFTAFLAGLLDGGGGGGGNGSSYRNQVHSDDLYNFFHFPNIAREWLIDHPVIATLIVFGIVFLFVIGIVLTWLSSRGKFMFLHNVVYDKAEVSAPWKQFSREGNSLFLWRLVFGLLTFGLFVVSIIYAYLYFQEMYINDVPFASQWGNIIGMIFYFLALMILVGYISLFLSDFIVPIMFKHRIKTNAAWRKFMEILWPKFGYFLLYGLFIFILGIAVVIAVIIFGFVTCCIGFLLLIIPYIGSVVFLPVSYTFRAYSVEFLEQFGSDYKIFPEQNDELVEA